MCRGSARLRLVDEVLKELEAETWGTSITYLLSLDLRRFTVFNEMFFIIISR